MDDYGRPQGDPSPDDDDGPRYNIGLISEWHELDTDHSALLTLARPGDLLEFQREAYQHWAVYIGDHARVMENGGTDDDCIVEPCVVHRANPADTENIQNMFSTSRSMSKGVHGIGAVVVESLRDVWGGSKVRINNRLDTSVHPFSSQTVVERALAVAHGESSLSYTAYNVVSNNCEHFASWCRSGWNISCQVARRGEQALKLAMVAGAALLPGPVRVLGGLCVAGLHMVGQMRRATGEAATNMYVQLTDNVSDRFDDITDNDNTNSRRHGHNQYITQKLD